jgi:hypothetical protein
MVDGVVADVVVTSGGKKEMADEMWVDTASSNESSTSFFSSGSVNETWSEIFGRRRPTSVDLGIDSLHTKNNVRGVR